MNIYISMKTENKKVKNHLSLNEMNDLLKEYRDSYEIYRHLLLIRMVYKGETISKASDNLNISRKTGERWIKDYNELGFDGLTSKYSNCGRKSLLSNEQKQYLYDKITGNEENYDLKRVKKLIKDEFDIEYSDKQVWVITREKLNLNYGKPMLKYSTRPENVPNTSKVLYKPGTKNIIIKPPVKFGINIVGFQGINCNSYMEENTKNNAYTFLKTLCNFRALNTNNKQVIKQIKQAITNPNLKIENIQSILHQNQLSTKDLINKINDELYNENSKQKSIEKIQKICKKEDIHNTRKIANLQREIIVNNLQNTEIKDLLSKEKPIYLILDNAKIHHAKIIEKVCDILNLKLIFLEPYCPDLNPIEDVWRTIKRKIYNSNYKTLNELIDKFKRLFYEIVDNTTFYENWLSEYFMV